MVLTNALLSIGFSLVANFTNVVHVPAHAVPQRVEDLRQFTIGDPHSPVDLYLMHRHGTRFVIRDGAVYMYEAPLSYTHLQNPELLPRLMGKPTLTAKQALALATSTVERLSKGTNPIARIKPVLKRAGKFEGKQIPFYEISWPKPYHTPGFGYYAGVEIDARYGLITRLELHDPSFFDYAFAQEIMNRVYTPEPRRNAALTNPPGVAPSYRLRGKPDANQVAETIASAVWLCRKLGVEPKTNWTLAAVDWDRTCLFTNHPLALGTGHPLCNVEFKNGDWFLSLGGTTVQYTAGDSYWSGDWEHRTTEQKLAFMGRIALHWQQLAKQLERTLVENLGIPKHCLAPYRPLVILGPADQTVGTETLTRVLVAWREKRDPSKDVHGLAGEFDLQTGRIKTIGFCDPGVIETIARAQGKELRFRNSP